MKRFLSLVLVFAMMMTLVVPGLSFAAGADDIAGDRVIAEMTDTAPALDEAITEEVWGAPAATVNTESANAVLHNYNAEVEPVSADFYFRWDNENLYIGMVSEDTDLAGHDDAWAGDGLQINVTANGTTAGAYVTLKADASSFNGGGAEGVQYGLVVADGKLNAIVAMPLEALGVTGEAGTRLTFNLLRIIGNAKNGYAGWLAWGPFFGEDSENNPGLTNTNTIVFRDSDAAEGALETNKTASAPALDAAITEDAWGAPVATVDESTDNAVLHNYNAQVEPVSADFYFRWDNENLYIGMVSEDTDLAGHDDAWAGDGLQINVTANGTTAGAYVTLKADASSFNGGGAEGVQYGLVVADGKINAMVAMPFAALGITPEYNGILTFNLLRIIGNANNGYAGWLAWGPFFGVGSENNPDVTATNKLILKDAEVEKHLFEATEIDGAPSFDEAITAAEWGAPAATISDGENNAALANYEKTAEDVCADVYFRWDDENLYVGLVSEDSDLRGDGESYKGDGLQLRLAAGTAMNYDEFFDVYVTLNESASAPQVGNNKGYTIKHNIVIEDGKLNVMLAVPFEALGVKPAEGKAIAFNMLRISGTKDSSYAGWLAWGSFFGAGSDNNPGLTENNVLVLEGKAQKVEFDPNDYLAASIKAAPDFTKPISDNSWGRPVATIANGQNNAVSVNYGGGTAEDITADIYLRWDEQKLYVGVVSNDFDKVGDSESWKGDGIQMRFTPGGTMSYDSFYDVYVTLNSDCTATLVGTNNKNKPEGNIVVDGDTLNIMVAVPLADIGVRGVEGERISFNMLRISGASGNSYAGWLAWGSFFGANSENNPGLTEHNTMALKNYDGADYAISVPETNSAPDFTHGITSCTWGAPAAHIENGKGNATLKDYERTAENISADVYFKWDSTKLYVGVLTEDNDLRGDDESYKGDGVQLRITSGTQMGDFFDIYVTLNGSNAPSTAGTNSNTLDVIEHGIVISGNKLSIMLAIPFSELGITPSEGELLAFNMLRISGTADSSYAGWLAWGSFFGAGSDNNPGVSENNVMKLGALETAPTHTVVTDAAVAPTCTESGLTEGSHCSVCGEVLKAQEIETALGHDFSEEWTIDKEATTEAAGSMSHHCSRCSEKSDVTEIAKLLDAVTTFKDVKEKSWFREAVDFVLNNGLMDGMGNGMFMPNEPTERAQLVTILWRLAGSPEVDDETPFTDLKQDWYKTAVAWAYKNNIVKGITDTEFRPNEAVTREQIAAILYRYCEVFNIDVSARAELDFVDASRIHEYAVDNMKWAFAEGLITGTTDEMGVFKLDPRGNATRAQIATILMRFCTENVGK